MNRFPSPRLLSFALLLALAPAARAAEDIPQFRSVLIDGQTNLFSLADATGAGRWVKLGEAFDGWKLASFDTATQRLTLTRDGTTRELGLADGSLGNATAPVAATVADADALLQKMRFEEMIEKALTTQQESMAKSMAKMMGKQKMSDAERTRMAEFQKHAMKVMVEEMDIPGMRSDVAKIYAETFTAAELKAQADFYTTPGGQAMIDKQPAIQQRMAELMMPRMMAAMPKIQAMAAEFAPAPTPAKPPSPAAITEAPAKP